MSRVIQQSVTLAAPAKKLHAMYLNARVHGAITGAKVIVGAKPGSPFSAFNGALTGKMLYVVPGTLIVQAWRSGKFHNSDPDSTLILRFVPAGTKCKIELTHVNVPKQDFKGVTEGWKNYYWKPWRKYLARG